MTMRFLSDDCSCGLHDFCNICRCICHGEYFNMREIRALYRIIEHEWISRDDDEAMEITLRISNIVKENELDRRDSTSTP